MPHILCILKVFQDYECLMISEKCVATHIFLLDSTNPCYSLPCGEEGNTTPLKTTAWEATLAKNCVFPIVITFAKIPLC